MGFASTTPQVREVSGCWDYWTKNREKKTVEDGEIARRKGERRKLVEVIAVRSSA
jgi:hypothetical protein